MFNLSGSEIVFILLAALVLLGPEKLPETLRKVGRVYAEVRKISNGFQSELRNVIEEPTRDIRNAFEEPARELRNTAEQAKSAFSLQGTSGTKPVSAAPQGVAAAVAAETAVAADADAVAEAQPAPDEAPPAAPVELPVASEDSETPA